MRTANSASSKVQTSSVTTSSKQEVPNYSSDKVTPTETSSNKVTNTETSSKKTNTETSSQKTDETSSKEPTTTEPSVDTSPDNAPLEDTQSNVIGYTYAINGTIVDWFTEGELVHAVFKQVNRYAVFDTITGQIVTDKALSGRPAKIRKYGDELWISYPDLQCIKIHDSKTFQVDGQYTGMYPSSMLHVDETLVATTNGMFLTSTFEQIASGSFNGHDSSIAITKSGNIMITENKKLYIFSQQ